MRLTKLISYSEDGAKFKVAASSFRDVGIFVRGSRHRVSRTSASRFEDKIIDLATFPDEDHVARRRARGDGPPMGGRRTSRTVIASAFLCTCNCCSYSNDELFHDMVPLFYRTNMSTEQACNFGLILHTSATVGSCQLKQSQLTRNSTRVLAGCFRCLRLGANAL